MQKYIVTDLKGVNIRKVMNTVGNTPVGKLDAGTEINVYQEYAVGMFGLIYTWGRITQTPDSNKQHRYVALSRPGKVWCEAVVTDTSPPPLDLTLEQRVARLEKFHQLD